MSRDTIQVGDTSGRVLLLSPHSDDIAYSLGGTMLSRCWLGRNDMDILTVFTRSRHAPYLQTDSEDEITRARLDEDQRYASRIGARSIQAPFGEAMTRGYPDIRSLYLVRSPEDDPLFAEVEAFLKPLLSTASGYRFVVAPLGIGGHIEHEIVRSVVVRSAKIPALYYEDQPYAADYSDYYLERFLDDRIGKRRAGLVCASSERMEEKLGALMTYASQFRSEDAAPLRWYASHRSPGRRVRSLCADWSAYPAEVLWGSEDAVFRIAAELEAGSVHAGAVEGTA